VEQRAELHSDMLLPIDDLATYRGKAKGQFDLIVDFPYRITGGGIKYTLTTAKTAITRKPPRKTGVATIILTSSENGVDAIAKAAGDTVPRGTRMRLIEIPVGKGGGEGIFDRLPKCGTRKSRVRAAKALAEGVMREAAHHHGWPIRRFLAAIIRDPRAAKTAVTCAKMAFLKGLDTATYSAAELRHADRFAFLYAAAAFAIQLKLLPWNLKELRAAVVRCHSLSRRSITAQDSEIRICVSRLKKLIFDRTRVPPASKVKTLKGLGGWYRVENGARVYYIFGATFRALFPVLAERRMVEALLRRQGILIPGPDGNLKQPIAPHSKKRAPRCYEFRFPR
jgi:hypothetical protein